MSETKYTYKTLAEFISELPTNYTQQQFLEKTEGWESIGGGKYRKALNESAPIFLTE